MAKAPVYDKKDDEKPLVKSDLSDREFNLGEYERRHGRAAGDPSDPRGEDVEDDEHITLKDLREAEATPTEMAAIYGMDQVGHGYVNKRRSYGFIRRHLGKRNRIFLIGGPIIGAFIIALVIFFSLLPFKILHIVNNLQDHFFASSQSAVQNETNVLFSDYLRKYVMPALKNCPGNVDRTCNPIQQGGLVSQLFKGWRNAKLEDQIANESGIEISYNPKSNHYYLRAPGLDGPGLDLGDDKTGFAAPTVTDSLDDFISKSNDGQFKKVSRKELRSVVNASIKRKTGWDKVMYRFKVRGLASRKYGLKSCIIACDTRDNFNDWKDNKTRAAKMILAERVLAPRSETLALVIGCVLSDSCDPSHRTEPGGGPNGEPQTKVEKDLQASLAKLALEDTGKYADVLAHSNGILKDGYQKYITKRAAAALVKAITGKDASTAATEQITGELIPVLGWINTISADINTLEHAKPKIQALAYTTDAAAMISTYVTYRTFADEHKTGHIDPAILGSFSDSLGPGNSTSAGGTASAEQAPLYGYLIDGDINANGTAVSSSFGGKAYAASTNPSYTCADGKPVPAGHLVCQEEVLGGVDSALISGINGILTALGPLKDLANFWNSSAGFLFRQAANAIAYITSSIFSVLPGYGKLVDFVGKAASPVIAAFTNILIPNPFSDNMGGGRTFDMAAGGADALGSDYSQNVLGGRKLTSGQASAILDEQNQQELIQYKNQSMLARLLDTDSNYSPTTKLAMALPDNAKMASADLRTAILSNPFKKIFSTFSPFLSLGHADAAASTFPDPFGVPQYGYPSGDPELALANKDPETYWTTYCSADGATLDWTDPAKENAKWIASSTVDPDTGMPENDATNPCLLLQATVGSAGAQYDSNLLTKDDLASGGSGTTGNGTTNGTTVGSNVGTTGGSKTGGCGGTGPYSALVSDGANQAGIDQGVDFTPKTSAGFKICAPAAGTITLASTKRHFQNTSGTTEIIEQLDTPLISIPSTIRQYIYYAEIIQIDPLIKVGAKVTKGQVIGTNAQSPGIEVGWAPSSTSGFNCGGHGRAQTPCGLDFDSWVQAQ